MFGYELTSDSVALVTGSSAGLGAERALALAQSGVRVVINYLSSKEEADKSLEDLKIIQKQHTATGKQPRSLAIESDVSQRAEISQMVDETVKTMGRLDLVVSNHEWTKIRNFQDLDENIEESD